MVRGREGRIGRIESVEVSGGKERGFVWGRLG